MSAEQIKAIRDKIREVRSDESIPGPERLQLVKAATEKLLSLSLAMRQTSRNLFNSSDDLSKKNSKLTMQLFETVSSKSELEERCKIEAKLLMELKKQGNLKLEEEKQKSSIYKEKFETIIKEVELELPYDEEEAKIVNEENIKLKERIENFTKEVERIDSEYKAKIQKLSKLHPSNS